MMPSSQMTTMIFGDSIALGAFDPKHGGWADRFKKTQLADGHITYNLSVDGDISSDILSRIRDKNEMRHRHKDFFDFRVIFAFGINDAAFKASMFSNKQLPMTSLIDFEHTIRSIIAYTLDLTKYITFVGLTTVDERKSCPVEWDDDLFYKNKQIQKYNLAIKATIKQCDSEDRPIKFIDPIKLLNTSCLSDGIHPNSKGHDLLYKKIISEL